MKWQDSLELMFPALLYSIILKSLSIPFLTSFNIPISALLSFKSWLQLLNANAETTATNIEMVSNMYFFQLKFCN